MTKQKMLHLRERYAKVYSTKLSVSAVDNICVGDTVNLDCGRRHGVVGVVIGFEHTNDKKYGDKGAVVVWRGTCFSSQRVTYVKKVA